MPDARPGLSAFKSRRNTFLRFATFLALLLSLGASAVSQNQQLTLLIREGQEALDAGDFARAASDFEQARQLAPDKPVNLASGSRLKLEVQLIPAE